MAHRCLAHKYLALSINPLSSIKPISNQPTSVKGPYTIRSTLANRYGTMPFPTEVVQSILCEPKVSFAFQLISNVSNGARLYSTRYTQTRLTFQSRKRRRTEEKDTTRWSQLRLQSSRSPFVPFLSVCSGGLWFWACSTQPTTLPETL